MACNDQDTCGGMLDINRIAVSRGSQESNVQAFTDEKSVFAHMNRQRAIQEKIRDEEPAKQKVITKLLWYFHDKSLADTEMVFSYVTEGRWKPDYVPPPAREEVVLQEPAEESSVPTREGLLEVPMSLRERMLARMKELE